MATEGFIQGTSGEEISLLVDGVKIMALQNLSWKASQSKSPIRGAGYRKPHAMGRAFKEYEVDFEVKELNKAIIEEAINSRRSREVHAGQPVSCGARGLDDGRVFPRRRASRRLAAD